MDPKKPDPEMIKELEFLLSMETLEQEPDWETLSEDLDEEEE